MIRERPEFSMSRSHERRSGTRLLSLTIGHVAFPQKIKNLLRKAALACAVLLCIKIVWFERMAPAAKGQDAIEARADLDMRRAYLVGRVANPEFGVADMPFVVASPYRQELAIATLSMTTVALTNMSFMDPRARRANRDAVQVMISRALSREIRRYDVIW
ncbi:MAG TPA: hypothetical protein VFS13_01060, partial [Steroidobacteraceae bacterium]|nr:hypothetical protein [Steroidobacteraceae bacterium]